MFQLTCPVCKNMSVDKYVYAYGTITCSEKCANEIVQKVKEKVDLPPLELPVATCEWCSTVIENDIPELYYNFLFCSTYCINDYKLAHGIKSF